MQKPTKPIWQKQMLFTVIATVVFMFAANSVAIAQVANYKVGDKIEVLWNSTWYKAEILETKAGTYKIRYDGYDSSWDEWLKTDRMRTFGGTTPANNQTPANPSTTKQPGNQNNSSETKTLTPKMAGGFPAIPGTAWKIDYGKGVTGYVFLFCKAGRWEVISPQLLSGAVTLMGTYRVQGSSLISKDGNGGQVTTFKMAWKAGVLELNDGKVILKLHYNGETQCK